MHLPKTLLLVLLTGLLTSKAQAALYAYFPLDSISDGTTANLASGGAATVNGTTISIVNDAVRGNVGYNSSTSAGNYISAGSTAIFSNTSNHTWSFWAKPATDQANNAVIIGNRGNGDGLLNDSQWVKFTPLRFEFNPSSTNTLVDYPDLRTSTTTNWQHYAVVKEGLNLRFYQNGTLVSSLNTTIASIGTPAAMNFQLFGDSDYTTEIWSGYLDDVALFNHALTASEISGLASGFYTPLTVPEPAKAGLAFAAFCLWGLRRKRAH